MVENDDGNELQHDRRARDRWHVGREIPLAMLVMVILQTAGGIWWLAQLSAKIDSAIATISEFRAERYTREDARRDRELLITLIDGLRAKDSELERRILAHEERDARELWKRK